MDCEIEDDKAAGSVDSGETIHFLAITAAGEAIRVTLKVSRVVKY